MKAYLKNYRQAPRKVRIVADLLRGKTVNEARAALSFLPKKASPAMKKLLDSAVANARSQGASTDDLMIKKITVDKGAATHRYNPNRHNRGATLRKIYSHVALELGTVSKK